MALRSNIKKTTTLINMIKKEICLKLLGSPILIYAFKKGVVDDINYFYGSFDKSSPMLSVLIRVSLMILTVIVLSRIHGVFENLEYPMKARLDTQSDYMFYRMRITMMVSLFAIIYDTLVIYLVFNSMFMSYILISKFIEVLAYLCLNLYLCMQSNKKVNVYGILFTGSIISGMMPYTFQYSIFTANLTYLYDIEKVKYYFSVQILIRILVFMIMWETLRKEVSYARSN